MDMKKTYITYIALLFINMVIYSNCFGDSLQRVLTNKGLGGFSFGMSLNEVNAKLTHRIIAPPLAARENPDCYYIAVVDMPGVYFVFVNDLLARIDVITASIGTSEGAFVGENQTDVARKIGSAKKEPLDYVPEGMALVKEQFAYDKSMRYEFYNNKLQRIISGKKDVVRWAEGCD